MRVLVSRACDEKTVCLLSTCASACLQDTDRLSLRTVVWKIFARASMLFL